ncbi:putative mitochondrial protein, partial [Mucuna pruriens]
MKSYHLEQKSLKMLRIRSTFKIQGQVVLIYEIELKNVDEALLDDGWVKAMKEELDQNKLDKNGKITRNKSRLVSHVCSQQKGINYTETFALVARLEPRNMILYQMNVKSVFLSGIINEEVNGDNDKKVDQIAYRGMVGSLIYLTTSRPDLMFSVCLCAIFQYDPTESHLIAIKRIFRYIKYTTNLGLLFMKSDEYNLVGYYDVDY